MEKSYFHYESQHGDIRFASKFTGLSVSCIYKKVERGDIPYHRIPGSNRLIFFNSELIIWLKGGTV